MDRPGGRWGEEGATDHKPLVDDLDGGEEGGGPGHHHHYYCPIYVGGPCSCPVEENTNNNDYTKLRKPSRSPRKASPNYDQAPYDQAYYDQASYEEAQQLSYDPYSGSYDEDQYFDEENYCSTNDYPKYPTSPSPCAHSHDSSTSCEYCPCISSSNSSNRSSNSSRGNSRSRKKNVGGCKSCSCSAHPNASRCDYFDPSKAYGCSSADEGPYNPPKIQVTAKILFGTVSAITDLKQKKAAKKN